jgi:hypothetical protein
MKRALATIIFILYVISSIGISISVHYCGGEVSSVSFDSSSTEKCVCGSQKMKNECCKDILFSFKTKYGPHKASQAANNFLNSASHNSILFNTYNILLQGIVVEHSLGHHIDTFYTLRQPLYILNRVFRI